MANHYSTPTRIALAALALVTLLAVAGCGDKAETAAPNNKEVTCTLGSAQLTTVPLYVTATGSLEAETSIMVSTRMMGWVKKIHVAESQSVRQGDLLISIDDSDLQAKKSQARAGIKAAEAVLANAEKMASRFENLYAEKSVSKAQLDEVLTGRAQAAAGLEVAKAGLTEVNVHLSYLDIIAPADGVIGRKMVEEGDMANPGMPLFILEQTDRVKVIAHLGEKDVTSVKAGDTALVEVTSVIGGQYEAVIERVLPTANPGSRTYDLEATLNNEDGRLRSGMFARVKVPVDERQAVLVPTQALIRRGQLTGVWIVDDQSRAHLRWVRLGHELEGQQEVLSGLAGNETLVLASDEPLAEGDKVVK